MKSQDPFGFTKALRVPEDKKTINKVHKLLFKKKIKSKEYYNPIKNNGKVYPSLEYFEKITGEKMSLKAYKKSIKKYP